MQRLPVVFFCGQAQTAFRRPDGMKGPGCGGRAVVPAAVAVSAGGAVPDVGQGVQGIRTVGRLDVIYTGDSPEEAVVVVGCLFRR